MNNDFLDINDQEKEYFDQITTLAKRHLGDLDYHYECYSKICEEEESLLSRIRELEVEQDKAQKNLQQICPHVFKTSKNIYICVMCHYCTKKCTKNHNSTLLQKLKQTQIMKNTTNTNKTTGETNVDNSNSRDEQGS
jgi:hypothetical protein